MSGTTSKKRRVAVGVEYDGSGFSGWQVQKDGRSVQEALERALTIVADEAISTVCAGRTDARVHAFEQVVHFDTVAVREPHSWVMGANSNLPEDVNLLWATGVDGSFHARFSARARTYRYVFMSRPVRSALWRDRAAWTHKSLDVERMREAAEALVGEHDFSSFRAVACQASSPVRDVRSIEVWRTGDLVQFSITANAFLQHMVRNVAGVLLAVGGGEAGVDWVEELLSARDRTCGGVTAPAEGLYLERVEYADDFALPHRDPVVLASVK